MNTKYIGIALVVVVLLAGAAGAFLTGFGPAPGGDDAGSNEQTDYEDTVVVDGTGDSDGSEGSGSTATGESGSSGASASDEPPFSFAIKEIENCGNTCREVTASIVNNRNETATGVTVRSVIFTGDNYENKVWEGSEELGDMEPKESITQTQTVKLSYSEAYAVKQNDGKILVKTYVVTDDATYVFKEKRDVA